MPERGSPLPAPDRDCPLCPRLVALRAETRVAEPGWHASPVGPFGDPDARLLILGLAPGYRGAHRTGRVFTGDGSGKFLFDALAAAGLCDGTYGNAVDDGLRLRATAIANAVACAPPQNRPTAAEIAACRPNLTASLAALPKLAAILTLGRIAHDAALRALNIRPADLPFAHGAEGRAGGLTIVASYHCSRLNTNTGRLTAEMFAAVLARAARAAHIV